ncbi:lysosomal proton-coupled steroid conjugate and bile acid symporter SLC46A3-like isoform X2 [Amphiura filiformis]|uniref:lysosomal proton-coupled steroid conjugate and bile acid symporter SLC46A3-like isoform X2 n=1 Tax=Amphiura filiformis TaxID=82378 RepID=UPI003B228B1D
MAGWWRHITVEPVLCLFMMGMFIQIPTSQMLLLQKVCMVEYNSSICDQLDEKKYQEMENIVQTKTSHWILYLQLFNAIPGAIMSLIFGASSDRLGRRVIMVIPVMGSIINGLVLIVSAYFIESDLRYLIIGALAMGCSGSFGTFYISVISYIADITDEESRTKRFGILESMVFIGGTVGLLSAGLIVQYLGFAAVYLFVVILYIIILIYVGFKLKESLPPLEELKDGKDKTLSCFTFLWQSIRCALTVFFKKRAGSNRKYLLLLQCMTVLGVLVFSGELDLTVLFTKHQPLSWNPSLLGIYLAVKNICKGVVLIVGLPVYFHIRGKKEPQRDIILAQLGIVSGIAALVMISFAKTTAVMMIVPFVGSLAGLLGAVMGSIKTQLVLPTEFGAMFACTTFFDAMVSLLGSVLFNNLYPATLSFWPGFSFLVMAGLSCVSLVILTYVKYSMQSHPPVSRLKDAGQPFVLNMSDECQESQVDTSPLGDTIISE